MIMTVLNWVVPPGVTRLLQRNSAACATVDRVDSSPSRAPTTPPATVEAVGRALNQESADPASHNASVEGNLSCSLCEGRFGGCSLANAKHPSSSYQELCQHKILSHKGEQ